MHIIIGIISVILATLIYVKGECGTKWLGKSNKNWKLATGIPIGLLGMFFNPFAVLACLTYLIACSFGYGDNNWLTKLIGKIGAITFCGVVFGLASFPVIGFWAILQGVLGGATFYWLEKKNGIINEPWVAILRTIGSTILLIGV